ncbi:MAG: hypothetical protein ACHQ1H_13390 [Nitrososphaerales archaeon]
MKYYFVLHHDLREAKDNDAYGEWLRSKELRKIFDRLEKETSFKYVNTYFTAVGNMGFDYEFWFEIPSFDALHKIGKSKAAKEFRAKIDPRIDRARAKTRFVMSIE